MSDEPKPSDDRNGCFLDKSWCCKVCDGEIPDGHLDHCDIWQLEKKRRDFIANDYNAVLIARDALAADLARVTAERDRLRVTVERVTSERDWARAERGRAREALDALMLEAKAYAAHNKLEPLAQRMYDIAEAALAPAQTDAAKEQP